MSELTEIRNHELYNLETSANINFNDFMKPGKFLKQHKKNIGTVLKGFHQNLKIYPYFMRFGHMFFYRHLTENEVNNGPVVYESEGEVCSF